MFGAGRPTASASAHSNGLASREAVPRGRGVNYSLDRGLYAAPVIAELRPLLKL